MDDLPITRKPFYRRAAGSLAQRVLLISIVLLGMPLLIHTFFLYHREYRENVADTFLTMRSLAESRALYIEQMIQNQLTIIQALEDDLPPDSQDRKEFIAREAKEYRLDELFFLEWKPSQQLICDSPLCQDATFLPFFQQALVQPSMIFINPAAHEQKDWLFVGQAIFQTNGLSGVLFIATPMERVLSLLIHHEYSPYPIDLSILDAGNKIVFSSEQKKIDLEKFGKEEGIYSSNGEDYLALTIPIEGTTYSLMLDVPEQSIANLQMKDYVFRIATLIFFIGILGGGMLIWLTRLLTEPMRALSAVMNRVSEGAAHIRYQPHWMGFEINVFGEQLNQMLNSLLTHQQNAEQERIARERLAQEFRIGRQIQASMLPTDFSQVPELEMAPGYLAAHEVSGDFYDCFVLKNGKILIAIADAADKGISACLFSLSFRSMLRTAAALLDDLGSIVQEANRLLLHDTVASSFFITAWIGIYDPKQQQLEYCNQGHPAPYLLKNDGALVKLLSGHLALGVESIEPKVETVSLQSNDLLFLYTDGVIEATDADHQFFGDRRLQELIQRSSKKVPQKIVQTFLEEIHLFSSGSPQADDITLLVIRFK